MFDPITAGIAVGGSIIGGGLQASAQSSANEANKQIARETRFFNSSEARKNRSFQKHEAIRAREWSEQMSNTAYQRQMKDMEAAGLNPILAATKGGGASTPSSSTPSGDSASAGGMPDVRPVTGFADAIKGAAGSALEMASLVQGLKQQEANIVKTTEETKAIAPSVRRTEEATKSTAQDVVRKKVDLPAYKAEAELRKVEAEINKKMAPYDAIGNRAKKVLDTIMDTWSGVSSAGAKRAAGEKTRQAVEREALRKAGTKGIRVGR